MLSEEEITEMRQQWQTAFADLAMANINSAGNVVVMNIQSGEEIQHLGTGYNNFPIQTIPNK